MIEAGEQAPRTATKARLRSEGIYDTIRRQICLLDHPPGTTLREQDLARQFGVSRTPIRRVLHWLERDGLVESRPGVGTTVTTVELRDLLDTYLLRARLAEAIGDTRAIVPDASVITGLERLHRQCDGLLGSFDLRRFGEINIELHMQLLRVIGSPALREITEQLFYRTTRIWFGLLDSDNWRREVEDMAHECAAIGEALRRGDRRAVGLIRSNHLSGVMIRLRQRLAAEPGAEPSGPGGTNTA